MGIVFAAGWQGEQALRRAIGLQIVVAIFRSPQAIVANPIKLVPFRP
jgi:hypothetical protein